MAVAFVQQVLRNPGAGSNTTWTATLPAAATTGNTAVVAIAYSATVTGVSGLGATWTRKPTNADPTDGSNALVDIWVGTGISGSLTDVTVTFSGATRPVINVSEWSGVNSTSQASGSTHASATSASTPSVTLASGEVAFGVVAIDAGVTGTTISSYTDSPSAWTSLSSGASDWMTYTLAPAYLSGATGTATRQGNFSAAVTSITQAVVLSSALPPAPVRAPIRVRRNQAVIRAAVR